MASTTSYGTWAGTPMRLAATPDAVRRLLQDLPERLAPITSDPDILANSEIVLAEVLNNIVEHAYRDQPEGWITVEIARSRTLLTFAISDGGAAMPGLQPPDKQAADVEVARDDLPEGGFGWFLIHELADDLSYERQGNRNRVEVGLRLG